MAGKQLLSFVAQAVARGDAAMANPQLGATGGSTAAVWYDAGFLRGGGFMAGLGVLLLLGWLGLVLWRVARKRMLPVVLIISGTALLLSLVLTRLVQLIPSLRQMNEFMPLPTGMAIFISVALGAALSLRFTPARWPDPVTAVLPGASVAAAYHVFTLYRHQNPFYASYYLSMIIAFFTTVAVITAGNFLLPLFDPYVRRTVALNRRNFAIATVLTVLLLIGHETVRELGSGGYFGFFGLLTLYFGSVLCLLAMLAAIVLILAGKNEAGTWAGTYGIYGWLLVLATWAFTGFNWFP
jgi:hypothetical protein